MNKTVLKAGQHQVPSNGGYSLDLRDISKKADGLLDAAQLEARRLLEEARRQADLHGQQVMQSSQRLGYEEGTARGREAGYAAALEEAKESFAKDQAALLATLCDLLENFKDSRERFLVEARQDVIVLAVAIASRVLSSLSELGDAASAAAIEASRDALELIGASTEVVIRTHPDDCSAVERFCQQLDAELKSSRHVRIVADPELSRGSAVVETADTTVDATVTERVRRIADELVTDWRTRLENLALKP